jgi:hypothetical protein
MGAVTSRASPTFTTMRQTAGGATEKDSSFFRRRAR